jgi:hypothetical protein
MQGKANTIDKTTKTKAPQASRPRGNAKKGQPRKQPTKSAAQAKPQKTKPTPEPYNDERTAADPLENARTPQQPEP